MRRSIEHLDRFVPDPDLWDAPERLHEDDLYLQDGLSARASTGDSDAGDET